MKYSRQTIALPADVRAALDKLLTQINANQQESEITITNLEKRVKELENG